MSFKRFVVVPIVLALVSGCGETSLEPATSVDAVADARGAPGPSASGSGEFIDNSEAPWGHPYGFGSHLSVDRDT